MAWVLLGLGGFFALIIVKLAIEGVREVFRSGALSKVQMRRFQACIVFAGTVTTFALCMLGRHLIVSGGAFIGFTVGVCVWWGLVRLAGARASRSVDNGGAAWVPYEDL